MNDEHDDIRAESEDRAETEDRERVEPAVPEEPEEPAYTPEEYQLAQQIKAHRLYKEEHDRLPYSGGELSYFLMKANIEHPLTPDDDDLKAARRKLEAAGS